MPIALKLSIKHSDLFSAQADGQRKTVALMLSKKGTYNPEVERPMHLLRCNLPESLIKVWQNTDRRPDARASAAASATGSF